jgi:hypothetical protein
MRVDISTRLGTNNRPTQKSAKVPEARTIQQEAGRRDSPKEAHSDYGPSRHGQMIGRVLSERNISLSLSLSTLLRRHRHAW